MKKQNWTYKKLGDICDIINGKNQKKVENPNGAYPIMGSGGIMGYADDYLCNEGTTIIGRKGSINKPIYVEEKFWNVDTAFGLQPKDNNESKFLFYLCKSIDFNRYDRGVTIPSLVKSEVLLIPISVPSTDIQKHIVSELDQLNSIIDKKKTQLFELDNLSQSIFCDMFGDPLNNEKGWNMVKIGDLSTVKTGPFGSMLHKEDYIQNGIPLVNPMHMVDFKVVADMDFTISKDKADELSNYILKKNDIIFARRGDIGRCAIVTDTEVGYLCGTGSLFVRFDTEIAPAYIMYVVRSKSFRSLLTSQAKGATMLNLNSGIISDLQIPLPPLPIQQTFAEKIEAIEAMKAKISQSLKETENLFSSRMDYYFA